MKKLINGLLLVSTSSLIYANEPLEVKEYIHEPNNPLYVDVRKLSIFDKPQIDENGGVYTRFKIPTPKIEEPIAKEEPLVEDEPLVQVQDDNNSTVTNSIAKVEEVEETPKEEDTKEPVEIVKEEPQEEIRSDYQYFLGGGLDISMLSVKKTDDVGIIILNNELDDTAIGINLQGGVVIQDKYIVSLNYDYLSLDDIDMSNYFLSLDYKFDNRLNPYLGISLGMSDITWSKDPLTNSQTKDEKQSSTLFGIQTGTIHPLVDQWSLYTKASYQMYEHKTVLVSTPAQATINHEDKLSSGVGVRYSF